MKLTRYLCALVCAGALLAGCYKVELVRNVQPAGQVQDKWMVFFFWGLAGEKTIDVRDWCADGNVRMVRTGANVGTGLVTCVTLGIVAPRKVYVQCGASAGMAAYETESVTLFADENGVPQQAEVTQRSGRVQMVTIEAGRAPGEWVAALNRTGVAQ